MERCIVTGEQLKCLFAGGLEAIEEHQQEVDSLNVFLFQMVIQTNMYLTMAAAVKEMETATLHIGMGEAIAQGSLMGAGELRCDFISTAAVLPMV